MLAIQNNCPYYIIGFEKKLVKILIIDTYYNDFLKDFYKNKNIN